MATVSIHNVVSLSAEDFTDGWPSFVCIRAHNDDRDSASLYFKDWQAVADAANDLANAARVHLEPAP